MATASAIKSSRVHSWLLGEIVHKGVPVEVWQRCTEEEVMSLEQEGRLSPAILTRPGGATAKVPEFWQTSIPTDVRRLLIVSEVNHSLVGVTLRLPDLDIDINDSVLVDLPPLTEEESADILNAVDFTA